MLISALGNNPCYQSISWCFFLTTPSDRRLWSNVLLARFESCLPCILGSLFWNQYEMSLLKKVGFQTSFFRWACKLMVVGNKSNRNDWNLFIFYASSSFSPSLLKPVHSVNETAHVVIINGKIMIISKFFDHRHFPVDSFTSSFPLLLEFMFILSGVNQRTLPSAPPNKLLWFMIHLTWFIIRSLQKPSSSQFL